MISMNFMQSWQNHQAHPIAPPKLPSKKAPLLAIVFGPRNSRHKTPVTKKIWEQTSKSHKSGPPNQHSSQPDHNEIIIFLMFFFQNIISQRNMRNSLISPFAPSHGGPPRKFRKRQWVWLRVHWPFPPSEASWRWLEIPMMFQSPSVFSLFFGFFFFRSLRFGRIQVLLIETSMCFSFFWGDPLKHTKKGEKKHVS